MPATPDDDIISTAEAVEILGYAHRSSITRLVAEGRLTPVRQLGGGYVFHRADVEAFAATKADEVSS